MTPQEAFVTRLRRHRQRNRISLDEIAAETRVKKEMFEALEANDLSAWPRGLYARAWVRTYACAVGLDPDRHRRRVLPPVPAGRPPRARDDARHRVHRGHGRRVQGRISARGAPPSGGRRAHRPAPRTSWPSAVAAPPARVPGPPATCSRASPARSRPAAASSRRRGGRHAPSADPTYSSPDLAIIRGMNLHADSPLRCVRRWSRARALPPVWPVSRRPRPRGRRTSSSSRRRRKSWTRCSSSRRSPRTT